MSDEQLDLDDAPEELLELGCLLMEARQRIAQRIAAGERVVDVVESERRYMLAAVAPVIDALARTAAVPAADAERGRNPARATVVRLW